MKSWSTEKQAEKNKVGSKHIEDKNAVWATCSRVQ